YGYIGVQQVFDWDGSTCLGLYSYDNIVTVDFVVSSHRPTLSGNTTIWWFNDYPSPDTSHYPITSTLTASSTGSGSYTYQIVSGSDKVGLGSDLASSYTSSSNQVDVTSRQGSGTAGDVVIT